MGMPMSLTTAEIESTKPLAYAPSTYTQGMATYPCFTILFAGGLTNTSNWCFPGGQSARRSIQRLYGDILEVNLADLAVIAAEFQAANPQTRY